MYEERSNMNDDPLSFAMIMVINANTLTGRCVRDMIREEVLDMSVLTDKAKNSIR